MKRWICLILVLTLACPLATVPAAAAEFSDLSPDDWAYGYMQDLYDRGIFTGYSDGTIRPGATATVAQTFALLSRYYSLSETELAKVNAAYLPTVQAVVPESLATFHDEIAVCLAAGIVKDTELRLISNFSRKITREEFSVYLVRTMQLEDEAFSRAYASLRFTDVEEISSGALFHIDLLVDLGIIGGYTDNSFRPSGLCTRAAIAKFISLSLQYLEENRIVLQLPGFAVRTTCTGILAGYDTVSLSVTGFDGLTRRFTRSGEGGVTIDGVAGVLLPGYIGSAVTVTADGSTLVSAQIDYAADSQFLQGTSQYCSASAELGSYVAIKTGSGEVRCPVTENTVFTRVDGESASYDTLTPGEFLTIRLVGGTAQSVTIAESADGLTGTVDAVYYGLDEITLLVADKNAGVYDFRLDYAGLPAVTSGALAVPVTAVTAGDELTLTLSDGAVSAIARTAAAAEYTGRLTAVSQTVRGTDWTLTLSDGSTVTLPLSASAAGLNSVGGYLPITNIKLGDMLTVTTADGMIAQAQFLSTAAAGSVIGATVSLTGTALHADPSSGTLIALVGGVPVTMKISLAGLQDAAGSPVYTASIVPGRTFTAYGTYSDAATFVPMQIVFD